MDKKRSHEVYKFKKAFFRKFGRKPNILLTHKKRIKRRSNAISAKATTTHTFRSEDREIFTIPEILSLNGEHRNKFLEFISILRSSMIDNKKPLSIDHTKLKVIEPDALLVLASEIKRGASKASKKLFLTYNPKYAPKDPQIKNILDAIGYWDHFDIKGHKFEPDDRLYFKITHDTSCKYEEFINMRDFFKSLGFLNNGLKIQNVFDEAITEAIANAVEHAYVKKQKIPTIDNAWWLCGYYDKEKDDLFFGCFDQGIGIYDTLQYNDDRILIKQWLEKFQNKFNKESEILRDLVHDELPKYEKKDRGYGFKKFKDLIDNYGSGSLTIYSKHGEYTYVNNQYDIIPDFKDHTHPLDGTLIVWKLHIDRKEVA